MKFLGAILALLFSGTASAGQSAWQDIQARGATTSASITTPIQHYRLLGLDEGRLREQLFQSQTGVASGLQARAGQQTLSLPLPEGGFAELTATPSEVLAPEIAANHSDIQTWKVYGVDGTIISGTVDFTPAGFHAMLDTASGDTLFIDPQPTGDGRHYLSFSKKANWEAFRADGWSCTTHDDPANLATPAASSPSIAARALAAKAGETLHTYRIAIATTAEYTAYYGSKSAAYQSIVTAVNRINQIYERDLSIRLQLVSDDNTVYQNANTDPYTNNTSDTLLSENVKNLNDVIGYANYDIGHVLATSGGGLARVASTCGAYKAEGASGWPKPQGDAFIIDYMAHEIGHQLGAAHTFNGVAGACYGGRETTSAYEPGSGSTIMAYAGVCSGDNLQTGSDSMMHSASIQQIQDYLHNGAGAACAAKTSLANNNPTVNAGADYTIPAGTPFILTGSGQDANTTDTLSYSWEQVDAGTASRVNVDTGNNALIRTHLPSATPTRTIPQMSDLTGRVQSAGETLPTTNRTLNFRLLARDSHGGIGYDDMKITVVDTGNSFAVTTPSSTTLTKGSQQTVSWNVAATDQAPINCNAVDIDLSTDNGNSFSNLLSNTPNDGSASVTLPFTLGNKNYIRVSCRNNIFFALSATNPAEASSSSNTAGTSAIYGNPISSTGGGGSVPLEWLLAGGSLYALQRRRKRSMR